MEQRDDYEAPEVVELGSIAEFTQGNFGRGSSDRFMNVNIPFLS